MQKNILWTGIEYHSLENCLITFTNKGAEITSSIIGAYADKLYKVDYRISTNHLWQTISFEIKTRLNNLIETISFQSDGAGNWNADAKSMELFNGCIDIDISLTPFTNTLPINRLKLAEGQSEKIKVLYIDTLNQQTRPVYQLYTRLSQTEYKYQNVPNDFESIITVDESGLVVKYPDLFERSMIQVSDYR